jgi:hypothetical protein
MDNTLTTNEKREAIRIKVVEAVPDMVDDERYLTRDVNALDIFNYLDRDKRIAAGLSLPIAQTLDEWDESTIDKLYELFYE